MRAGLTGALTGMAAVAIIGLSAHAQAATTITNPGDLMNLGSGWRTASVSKGALDPDGNNVLGSDGYWVFGAAAHTLVPTYFTGISYTGSIYGGNGSYIAIDNPVTTPGGSPTTLTSGTLNPFVNGWYTDFTFTLTGSVPSVISIGLMIDNLDIAAYNPSGLQIFQTNGSAASPQVATTSAAFNNRNPDWVFFNIDNGTAGETFAISVDSGPNGCNCLGAISVDSNETVPVPEPASLTLLGLAVAALAVTRRRTTTAAT